LLLLVAGSAFFTTRAGVPHRDAERRHVLCEDRASTELLLGAGIHGGWYSNYVKESMRDSRWQKSHSNSRY